MSESKEVTNWREQAAALAKEVRQEEQPDIVVMSLAGGMMSIMDTPVPNNEIEVVILKAASERTWYDRPFDPEDRSPPDCYAQKMGSDDPWNPTMVPAENVPNPPASTCAECPLSKLKSAPNGKGAACKLRRKIICASVSAASDPDAMARSQLMIINVPPTSGKNFNTYMQKLLSYEPHLPFGAITKISYVSSKKTLHEMKFDMVEQIQDDNILEAAFNRQQNVDGLLLVPYSYEQDEPEEEKSSSSKKRKY